MENLKQGYFIQEPSTLNDPALPPVIISVICTVIDSANMEYSVKWRPRESDPLPVEFKLEVCNSSNEVLKVIEGIRATEHKFLFEKTLGNPSSIAVAPVINPEAKERVQVYASAPFEVTQIMAEEQGLEFLYKYTERKAVPINVFLYNSEKAVHLCLPVMPHETILDLHKYKSVLRETCGVNFSAEEKHRNTTVTVTFPSTLYGQIKWKKPDILKVEVVKDAVHVKISAAWQDLDVAYTHGQAMVYTGETLVASSEKVTLQVGKNMEFQFDTKLFETGNPAGFQCCFRMLKGYIHSMSSDMFPVILEKPQTAKVEVFPEANKIDIYLQKNSYSTHWISLRGRTTSLPTEQLEKYERITLDSQEDPSVLMAYIQACSAGPYVEVQVGPGSAYYLGLGETNLIYRSDRPIKRGDDIKVHVPADIELKNSYTGSYFKLDSAKRELSMENTVWNIQQDKRKEIRTDFNAFLLNSEAQGMTVGNIRKLRLLAAAYLPQTPAEVSYYQNGYENNYAELFEGEILRVQYSMNQNIGDTGEVTAEEADQQEKIEDYVNHFVGGSTVEFHVRLRGNKICLDPFVAGLSHGKYVPNLIQPSSAKMVHGGGGMIDMMSNSISQNYMGLFYPKSMLHVTSHGSAFVKDNPAFISANKMSELLQGRDELRSKGYISSQVANVAYLCGRAHITPCIYVKIDGVEKIVELGTTLHDMLQPFGEKRDGLKLRRGGLNVYILKRKDNGWMEEYQLCSGDEISWEVS